jgi:hypothetical protein
MPTNSEGLTWLEWLAASKCEALVGTWRQPYLKKAWRDSEDPTEYGNELRSIPVLTDSELPLKD